MWLFGDLVGGWREGGRGRERGRSEGGGMSFVYRFEEGGRDVVCILLNF